jgi:hypothetical protein
LSSNDELGDVSCHPKDLAREIKRVGQNLNENELTEVITSLFSRCHMKGIRTKGSRKATARNMFIGKCMKDKKGMEECSNIWSTIPESEKTIFQKQADEKNG